MATFVRFEPYMVPGDHDSAQRCDAHSRFDPDGFPLPLEDGVHRCWTPVWGGSCTEPGCGQDC